MRYWLGQCEYKWSHAGTRMEDMWIMRAITPDIYKLCQQPGFDLRYQRSNSQTLPGDVYCRCDIYVDVPDSKQGTHFKLTHGDRYVEVLPQP
jgi:hypothetical protein